MEEQNKVTNIRDHFQNHHYPDLCVICHEPSGYYFDTPIGERRYYFEGVGQLCEKCYKEMCEEEYRKEAERGVEAKRRLREMDAADERAEEEEENSSSKPEGLFSSWMKRIKSK